MNQPKTANSYKSCTFYNRITYSPTGIYVIATPTNDTIGNYVNPAGDFFTLELSEEYSEGAILGTLEDAIEELKLIKYEKN